MYHNDGSDDIETATPWDACLFTAYRYMASLKKLRASIYHEYNDEMMMVNAEIGRVEETIKKLRAKGLGTL